MVFYLLSIAIFIALLLLVSSKIRNAASAAYEPEKIDRESFYIYKPEGFLNPVEYTDEVPFEAYTREVGERAAGRLRKSLAKLSVRSGLNLDSWRNDLKRNAEQYVTTVFDEDAPEGQRICVIETKKTENEITTVFLNKLVESRRQNKTFDLQISILEEHREEFEDRIGAMLNSFTVK